MWNRELFLVSFFTLTILATQSHSIQKRGILSKLFGSSKSKDVEADMSPRERSKLRELLKNPVVISMLSAAVGMAVQQALAAKDMGDVCSNKYIKMASSVGSMNPQLQQAVNLLGCNGPNRKYGSDKSKNKYGAPTTPAYSNDEDEDTEQEKKEDEEENKDEDTLESSIPPEKHSKLQQFVSIARGEKGAKRNFVKGLFGLNKKDKTFKQGHKLPSSSYKLDKDDAEAMKSLEKQFEQFNKGSH